VTCDTLLMTLIIFIQKEPNWSTFQK